MYFIFVTFDESNAEISREIIELQFANIYSIFSHKEVLKFSKGIYLKEEQP